MSSIKSYYRCFPPCILLRSDSDVQSKRLSEISKAAQEAKTKIGEHLRLAERILQLAERSRQYMNENEKVAPFPSDEAEEEMDETDVVSGSYGRGFRTVRDSPATLEVQRATTGSSEKGKWAKLMCRTAERSKELAEDIRARTGEQPPQLMNMPSGEEEEEYDFYQPSHLQPLPTETSQQNEDNMNVDEALDSGQIEALENFHKVYNRALMDELTLESERDRLRQENEQLQDLLGQYLEGTQVRPSTVDHDNPLFVVNGRTGSEQLPVRARGGPSVAINATETVNKVKLHSTRRG